MNLNLSPPTNIVFIISVIIAILAVAVRFAGINIPAVSGHVFETLLIAYVILVLGNLLRGL